MVQIGADIALHDLLVNLASCDRRQNFTRPCRARLASRKLSDRFEHFTGKDIRLYWSFAVDQQRV